MLGRRAASGMATSSLRSVAFTFGDPTANSRVSGIPSRQYTALRRRFGGLSVAEICNRVRDPTRDSQTCQNVPHDIRTVRSSASAGAESSIIVVTNNSLANNLSITVSAHCQSYPTLPESQGTYGVSSTPIFPAPIHKTSDFSLITAQFIRHTSAAVANLRTVSGAHVCSSMDISQLSLEIEVDLRRSVQNEDVRKTLLKRMTCRKHGGDSAFNPNHSSIKAGLAWLPHLASHHGHAAIAQRPHFPSLLISIIG